MTTRHIDAKDAVARGLGWFSLALGTAQIAAPRGVAKLLRLRGDHEQAAVMRAVGVREIATGVGILAEARPARWLWARVAGDAMDLALLARADGKLGGKLAGMAAVAGVAVPDVIEGARLSRANGGAPERVEMIARKSVTVRKSRDDVHSFWHDFENLPRFWQRLDPGAQVELVEDRPGESIAWRTRTGRIPTEASARFVDAPGDQGTEVHVEVRYAPPAGDLGVTIAKLIGEEPGTKLTDDLRRFKQIMETGQVIRSDATLHGHSLVEHLTQRPAQPVS
jgi:uncharacterized membrane protein